MFWRTKQRKQDSSKMKADREFSRYIRLRDMDKNGCFVCISCSKRLPITQADCGHYVNRQHMSLRYNEMNCNAQCRSCNRYDEGNQQGYRRGLVAKYGEDRVKMLEAAKYRTNRLSSVELEILANEYKKKWLDLCKTKGVSVKCLTR